MAGLSVNTTPPGGTSGGAVGSATAVGTPNARRSMPVTAIVVTIVIAARMRPPYRR